MVRKAHVESVEEGAGGFGDEVAMDDETEVLDGAVEALYVDSATAVSLADCASVVQLQRSRKGVHLWSRAPIVSIAWLHCSSKPRWWNELPGVVEQHHEQRPVR